MLTFAGLFLLAHVFLAAGVLPAKRPSIPCNENEAVPATQAAFQHISAQHHHGYKYKLRSSTSSHLLKKDDLACEFHLELDLEETTCHVVNPKPVEECAVRETHETKVESKCNVTLTVAEGKPTVKKYSCSSDPASAEEPQKICPDCPSLLPLHYPAGLDSIRNALKKFNEESNETSNFKLLEVGRLSTQYILTGQSYLAEFAIVSSDCPAHVICVSGRGKAYGFCKSTVLGNDEISVDCEIYDAQNLTDGHHHHHHPHHHHPGGKHNSHHSHGDSHEHPHYHHPGGRHNSHRSQGDSHEHPHYRHPGGRHNSHRSQGDSHEHPHYRHPGGRHNSHHSQGDSHEHPRRSHPGWKHHGHPSHNSSQEHPRRSRPGWKHNGHPSHNSSHEHPHRPHNLPPFFSGSPEHPHPDTDLHHCRGQVKIPPSIHPICPHPIRHMPPAPADNNPPPYPRPSIKTPL